MAPNVGMSLDTCQKSLNVHTSPSILLTDRQSWRWIPVTRDHAAVIMDQDRRIFQSVKQNLEKPILRFYRWEKTTLTYGRIQGIDTGTLAHAKSRDWDVARRPTGGGKVLHHQDTCFSVIWKKESREIPWNILDSYRAIHRWVQMSLMQLGYETNVQPDPSIRPAQNRTHNNWCFQNAVCFDLMKNGGKVVGGAQWRDHRAALHQGSIQIEVSDEDILMFKNEFSSHFNVSFNGD